MIDGFTYPLGDIQTWDGIAGEKVLDIPSSLKQFFAGTNNELHLAHYSTSGILGPSFNNETANTGVTKIPWIRDKISGFTFQAHEPLEYFFDSTMPDDRELAFAADVRHHLHPNESAEELMKKLKVPGKDLFKKLSNNKGILNFMFNYPIKEYEAANAGEIEKILAEISSLTSKLHVKRLWLRGQSKEYKISRPTEVLDKLPFGEIANDFPSLVPSLGRFALNNPGKVNLSYAVGGPSNSWDKPFMMWFIRENRQWLEGNEALTERFERALTDETDKEFRQLLAELPWDRYMPTEIDDLRQWFFAFYKYSSLVWVLQQYGYYASMLDVTWDIDTALFFSQAQMIDQKYCLPAPNDDRVIYVFAERKNSSFFKGFEKSDWGDDDWVNKLPLRVERQRAACLVGSTWFRQNFYGHLVIAKIRLHKNCITTRTVKDVFPSPDEDLLLKTLLEARPSPEGLYY